MAVQAATNFGCALKYHSVHDLVATPAIRAAVRYLNRMRRADLETPTHDHGVLDPDLFPRACIDVTRMKCPADHVVGQPRSLPGALLLSNPKIRPDWLKSFSQSRNLLDKSNMFATAFLWRNAQPTQPWRLVERNQ